MAVGTYDLISVDYYKGRAGISDDEIYENAFSIYCSSGDASAATVKVDGTNLVLVITDGADAGTNTLDLTHADNDTLTKLVDEINDLTGWVANLLGESGVDSVDLVEIEEQSCLGSENVKTFEYVDNYSIEQAIAQATDIIESYLNRKIKNRTYTLEKYTGGVENVFLKNYPVTNIIQVSEGVLGVIQVKRDESTLYSAHVYVDESNLKLCEDGAIVKTFDITDASYDTLTELATAIDGESGWNASLLNDDYAQWNSTLLIKYFNTECLGSYETLYIADQPTYNYKLDDEAGILHLRGGFVSDYRELFVSYEAGYSTVPDDLKYYAFKLIYLVRENKDSDPNMKSERLEGDYSYTKFSKSEAESIIRTPEFAGLEKYKRRLL